MLIYVTQLKYYLPALVDVTGSGVPLDLVADTAVRTVVTLAIDGGKIFSPINRIGQNGENDDKGEEKSNCDTARKEIFTA